MNVSGSFLRAARAASLGLLVAGLGIVTALSAGAAPSAGSTRSLSDAAAGGRFLSRANPSLRLTVALLLKGAHQDEIPMLLRAQGDRHSPLFRRWMTTQQYGSYFGSTPRQVRETVAYLRSRGFDVSLVAPNNRLVVAHASASAVEATFATPIEMRQSPQGQIYYANRFDPVLPSALPWVQDIGGLDSYHVVHSHHIVSASGGRPRRPDPQATVQPGKFAFGPQDLYTAYSFNTSYTGSGTTIAIPVVLNFLQSDVFSYDSQFGISNPATFSKVYLAGTCASPCPLATPGPGDGQETALDTELSHAAAPNAALDVVSVADHLGASQALGFEYIANVYGSTVQTVTSSYGACESQSDPFSRDAMSSAIDQGVLEGQTWFGASGDDGSDDCKNGTQDVDFPPSSPNMVAVGGTTLNTSIFMGNVQSYSSEYAWNDSGCGRGVGGATGGGASRFFGKPTWQNHETPIDHVRDVPDLAAEADPFQQDQFPADCPAPGGYWVIYDNKWYQIGGTSGASPFWAGIFADVAQLDGGNLGLVSPALYKLEGTTAFNSITIGNNAFDGVAGYDAKPNYSQVTGLGSPIESTFLSDFIETLPPAPGPTSFPAPVPHPSTTPVAVPTARAFIPINTAGTGSNPASYIGIFSATVGSGQGAQVQLLSGPGYAIGVAPVPGGNAVYVLERNGIIDKVNTNAVPYTYTAGVFASGAYRANAIAVSGNTAYVSDGFNNQVDAVNLKTSAVTSINVGHGPTVMAPNPKATALYVLNTGDGTLGVINTSTNAVVQTVKVGPNPVGIAVNHSGKLAYVVNGGAGTVTPVKLATKSKAEKAIYVGGEPTSIAINPSNTLAFVTNLFCPISSAACNPSGGNGQESYGVVEILTLKTKPIGVECCIAVGQSPQTAAFEPTGHYLWVLNAGGNSASIIDSFTNEVTATATSSEATSQWESSSPFVFQTPF